MTEFSLHPDTTVGTVALTVSDPKRSEKFYTEVLGFQAQVRGEGAVALSADGKTPLLELRGDASAPHRPAHTTGLYHFAVLVPSRAALGRSLRRLAEVGYPIQGGSDHLVSEALYLADPDGNGIEIYRDRPREAWEYFGNEIHMETDPLDFEGLLREPDPLEGTWHGLEAGTRMGHVHLNVSELKPTEEFYRGVLGFDVMLRRAPGALFISAGRYHHHLGLNTWNGAGAPPPPTDALGLRHFSIVLPNLEEFEKVAGRVQEAGITTEEAQEGLLLRDPSQNGVLLTHQQA